MKYNVICHRSAQSVFGAARSPLKHSSDTTPLEFSFEDATSEAARLNALVSSPNVWYSVEEAK